MVSAMSSPSSTMGLNMGMGNLGPLANNSMGSIGGNTGNSMDSISDLDFFTPSDWEQVNALISMSGGGVSLPASENLGVYSSNMTGNGVSGGAVSSGNSVSNMQTFTTTNSWGGVAPMKSAANTPANSTGSSSLQLALLGNQSLANMTSANINNTVGISNTTSISMNGKPHPGVLAHLQRSNSTSFEGQKSPSFSPGPGGTPRSAVTFNMPVPGQRQPGGLIGYPSQRSPVSGVLQNRNHGGQFGMGFQRKTMSPLLSPQPGEKTFMFSEVAVLC